MGYINAQPALHTDLREQRRNKIAIPRRTLKLTVHFMQQETWVVFLVSEATKNYWITYAIIYVLRVESYP